MNRTQEGNTEGGKEWVWEKLLNWVVKEVLSNEITVGGDMETGDEKGQ